MRSKTTWRDKESAKVVRVGYRVGVPLTRKEGSRRMTDICFDSQNASFIPSESMVSKLTIEARKKLPESALSTGDNHRSHADLARLAFNVFCERP